MDFPSANFAFPTFPASKHFAPENRAAPPEDAKRKSAEIPSIRSKWTSRIIEAQASRVINDTTDALELKPVTVESRPPANVRRFLEIATPDTRRGSVIDTYA